MKLSHETLAFELVLTVIRIMRDSFDEVWLGSFVVPGVTRDGPEPYGLLEAVLELRGSEQGSSKSLREAQCSDKVGEIEVV